MAAIIAIVLLTACSKEAAIKGGLEDAGTASPAADCMSREMAKRLSTDQLQKLSRAADGSSKSFAEMSIADYVAAAQRVGDPEIVVVTGTAAAYCNAL